MPTLLGGKASEPPGPAGPCPSQRDKFLIGPGPDAGGSNQGKAGCVHVPEKFGIDTAPCFSPLAGPAAEGACARVGIVAGIVATVTTATKRRKSRCVRIGRLR